MAVVTPEGGGDPLGCNTGYNSLKILKQQIDQRVSKNNASHFLFFSSGSHCVYLKFVVTELCHTPIEPSCLNAVTIQWMQGMKFHYTIRRVFPFYAFS